MKSKTKQVEAAPAVPPIEWSKKPHKVEGLTGTALEWKSDCGRYTLRKVMPLGMSPRWQVWGPQWAGIQRITAKLWEGKKEADARKAAEAAKAQFITEGSAE